ncbi:MAG: peptidoglycan DD-metalloendopeptidase family protein, partial [Cyanobacteriota bacterium]
GDEHGTHILNVINSENDDASLWGSRAISSGQWADSLIEFVNAAKDSGQPTAVVNLSFDLTQTVKGNETTRYEFTSDEWAALEYAHQHKVILIAAAGNDADTMSALGQASQQFDNIITVGSAQNLDSSVAVAKGYDRAYYSSYGDGLSLVADGGTPDAPVLSVAGEMSGTSVAAAKVTGAVSQVWAANPQLSYQQVIGILNSTATDLLSPNWDAQTGAGLLNRTAAVDLAKVTNPLEFEVQIPVLPITWSSADNPSERAVSTEFQGKYYNWYSYTVKPGDTLSMIALRTMSNSSYPYYNFIADYNSISNPSLIYAGQIIQVPTEVSVPTDEFMGKYYVWESYIIQDEDTLSQVALQRMGNGSEPYYNFIAQKNGIADPSLILAGDTILVPLEVSAPTAPNPPINQPQPIDPNKFYKPLSAYTVTSEFGWRTNPISGQQRLHGGIDLAAPKGTPVKAAKGGTVVYAGWNNQGYGNLVIIDHGSGVRTYYAHLSSVSVSNGSQVSAGATVGGVGSTGYSTGNHLHFEVRVNNQRKNPRDYVQF